MDGRKNNGGHSTRKKIGLDKRKTEYREALKQAATIDDVKDILIELKNKAKGGDSKSIQLFLEYYLGKPKESLQISGGENIALKLKDILSFEE